MYVYITLLIIDMDFLYQFNLGLIAPLFTVSFQEKFEKKSFLFNFQMLAGLWLVGEVDNHVAIYGSKVAAVFSAFQRRSCFNSESNSHQIWEMLRNVWSLEFRKLPLSPSVSQEISDDVQLDLKKVTPKAFRPPVQNGLMQNVNICCTGNDTYMHYINPPKSYKLHEGITLSFESGNNQPFLLAKGVCGARGVMQAYWHDCHTEQTYVVRFCPRSYWNINLL